MPRGQVNTPKPQHLRGMFSKAHAGPSPRCPQQFRGCWKWTGERDRWTWECHCILMRVPVPPLPWRHRATCRISDQRHPRPPERGALSVSDRGQGQERKTSSTGGLARESVNGMRGGLNQTTARQRPLSCTCQDLASDLF